MRRGPSLIHWPVRWEDEANPNSSHRLPITVPPRHFDCPDYGLCVSEVAEYEASWPSFSCLECPSVPEDVELVPEVLNDEKVDIFKGDPLLERMERRFHEKR